MSRMKIAPRLVEFYDRLVALDRAKLVALYRAHRRLALTAASVAAAVLIASIWFVASVVRQIPDREALRGIGSMAQATTLLDARDRQAFTIFREQRIDVPLSGVSRQLVQAILAIEDQRFYDHRGVDIVRVAGAALNNVVEGRLAQGGSTLTQQLARQSLLTPDKTFRRKLTEIFVAARLERQFSKDEILGMYLNKVYFGDGLYGVEAASLGYFGKHAAEVSLAQAALLAGLVKAPSSYAPTVSVERAKARRNLVLQAMRDEKMIDRAAYDAATQEPVVLDDGLRRGEAYGQYFKEEVRRFLVQRFGWDRVYQGGLKVYTTVDLDMQKAAETVVGVALAEIEKRQGARKTTGEESLQAALVAMDPHTGDVRAMVGGRDFAQSSFNRATQAKRQPGSAFKPFVYAAALERGFSPATLIDRLDEPIMTLEGAWVPEDEHLDTPSMTMRTALRTSSNRAAVRMLDDVGIPITVEYAQRLGVGSVPSVPSLALGSGEVTLLSMTSAFATFANEGVVPTPVLVRRVETSDGQVLYRDEHINQRAITEVTAFQMAEMLADVVNSGTGWPARREGFMLPAAGKTGTTNDYHDAWFVGFTPRLATGVWVGYDQPRTIIGRGYAAELAVPLWGRFMMRATKGNAPDWYEAPKAVTTATICPLSGKLATQECAGEGGAHVYTEYFASDRVPTEYCDLHVLRARRGVFGGIVAAVRGESGNESQPPPAQAHVATEGPAPSPVATNAKAAEPEAPKKKGGFWSKVFGGGRREDSRRP